MGRILLVAFLRDREFLFITLSSDQAYSKFTIVCTKHSLVPVKVKKFNDVACLLENYDVHIFDETIICKERNARVYVCAYVWFSVGLYQLCWQHRYPYLDWRGGPDAREPSPDTTLNLVAFPHHVVKVNGKERVCVSPQIFQNSSVRLICCWTAKRCEHSTKCQICM